MGLPNVALLGNILAQQAAKALSIDVWFFIGQSNNTANAGFWTPYPNSSASLNGPPINPGSPGPNVWTFNTGFIPGVRDSTPPAAVFPLLPMVPFRHGCDWFDALQQEDLQHGESAGFAFFDTLNRLGNTNRLFIAVNLSRDSYGLNNYNFPSGAGGIWPWFETICTFLVQLFGNYTNAAGVSKLRFPGIIWKGGEEDAGQGATAAVTASGTSLTLPLSGATIGTASAITIGTPSGDFPNATSTLVVDTNMGRALVTYTGATTGGGFTGCSTSSSVYSGATIVGGQRIQRADFAGSGFNGNAYGILYAQNEFQTYIRSLGPSWSSAFVPMFIDSQFDEPPTSGTWQPTAELAFLAWLQGAANGVTNPLQYINANYHRPSSTLSPGIHIGAGGQLGIGEKTAQCVNQVIYQGNPWSPLYATSASISGTSAALVNFNVPFGDLVTNFNFTRVYKSGQNPICGFNYRDSGGTATVSSVQIMGAAQMQVNFSGAVNGNTGRMIGFAQAGSYSSGNGQNGFVGTYTNFCDQDPFVSKWGQPQWNFLVPMQIGF
jgi:hypothetical protein